MNIKRAQLLMIIEQIVLKELQGDGLNEVVKGMNSTNLTGFW